MIFKKGSFTMRLQLLHLTAALALLGFAGSHARAVDIYVLSGLGTGTANDITRFGKIDSITRFYTEISPDIAKGSFVSNLAWNAANSSFYTTENIGANQTLRTLDVSGALSSSLGTIGASVYGMAYRPADSSLYAWNYDANTTGTINPANGAWSVLNASPGIAFSSPVGGRYTMHNGTIYASVKTFVGSDPVGRFGTVGFSASSTFSPITNNDPSYISMVLASDGTSLFGISGDGTPIGQTFYSINPATGVASPLGPIMGANLGSYFYGAGVAITPVPEPSTYALTAIATGVLAYAARRRKARQA